MKLLTILTIRLQILNVLLVLPSLHSCDAGSLKKRLHLVNLHSNLHSNRKAMREYFIKLHLSVVLAGCTGVLGRLISLHEFPLTFLRVLFACVIIWLISFIRSDRKMPRRGHIPSLFFVGALLGLHWLFFYASIKASNVSVGVVCYSLVGFYSAVLEPLINHRRISVSELLLSLITLAGVTLIFGFDIQFRTGILLGAVSSLLASLFTIYNKRLGDLTQYPSPLMLRWELMGALAVLTAAIPIYFGFFEIAPVVPTLADLCWLLALASFCTIGLQLLQIQVLKKVSAFTVNLTYNLEPVYSIMLAIIFFNESAEMTPAFLAGMSMIILSVALQTISTYRSRRSQPEPMLQTTDE